LSEEQQLKQSSDVFEAFGLHWLLTVEIQESNEGTESRNILVVLRCLSADVPSESRRAILPLKGCWDVPFSSDGQPRVYNGRVGIFCNVIGELCPADAVKFDSFESPCAPALSQVLKRSCRPCRMNGATLMVATTIKHGKESAK
jgi:hypothetical protein